PLQPRTWHGGADVSLVARLGGWALILEDRALTPLFEGGWSPISGDMAGVAASALYAGFRPHNQVSWGVRRGGFTLFMSEDFTLGSNPSSGARWFFDSNAPDVVLGLAWTLEH